jgi:hypothetical protein
MKSRTSRNSKKLDDAFLSIAWIHLKGTSKNSDLREFVRI